MNDLYIASCEKDGGIYRISSVQQCFELKEKTPLDRPMYLAAGNGKIYALLRRAFKDGSSGICSFDVGCGGKLMNMSETVSTRGIVASHLCINKNTVYAANYLSGSVIRLPDTMAFHSGKSVNPQRQEAPHPHYIGITPDDKYVCVSDLGLDRVLFYNKMLNFKFYVSVPSGYGARHLVFSENGEYLYCVNELISSVTVFKYDGGNTRRLKTYSALPDGFSGQNSAAAIRFYKNRIYVSNRGHNSIAVFNVSGEGLEIAEFIQTGSEPRDFDIFDDILVCCNLLDNTVTFHDLGKNGLKFKTLYIKSPLCVLQSPHSPVQDLK